MKRLWHYKNMKMSILFCLVLFMFFLVLGICLFINSISLYPQYGINYDDLFYEELTFNRYETKRYTSGKAIGYKYEIYFEEYEKPFIINTITNKKLNKTALATTLGVLGGKISGAGAQNAKGLANAILRNTSATVTGMISGIRALTGNTAFSNVVAQALNEAIIKIGATTIGTAVLTSIRNFYLVD